MDEGACTTSPVELFFAEGGRAPGDYSRARALCAVCPVVQECLDYALMTAETAGMWGGMSPSERRAERRRRHRETGERVAILDRKPPECGTDGGYQAHYRKKEPACQRCLAAHRLAQQERRERREGGEAMAHA